MKTARCWLTALAVTLFCAVNFSSRHPVPLVDFFRSLRADAPTTIPSPDTAATAKNVACPTTAPGIDEGLRQLERDIARAATAIDPDVRANLLIAACLRWADFEPADALRIARILRVDQVANATCEDLVQKWAARDFAGALAWSVNEPMGEQRDRLMARLAYVRAQSQPGDAAKLVVEQIPAGAVQTEAGFAVLHQWALRDFDAALAWTNSFPAELQERGRAELAAIARFRLAQRDAR